MNEPVSGRTLVEWGFRPGRWFPQAIAAAEKMRAEGANEARIRERVAALAPAAPTPLRASGGHFHVNIEAETEEELANVEAVKAHMRELMRVPTIEAGAIMPDACPAGAAPGTIPVGGIVAARDAIHPGMHSADICCSMAVSVLKGVDPKEVLDAGMERSHFGGGGRPQGRRFAPPADILAAFAGNRLLKEASHAAVEHFGTQGDGNHFFSVGRLASTGEVALVTHHGSRKPGAMLYKAGMAAAERHRLALSPETPKHNAWIPADSAEGEAYWQALQTIRAWTKANHFAIHDEVAKATGARVDDRFWNEHNFVFRRNGLYYHAKGATPAWDQFAEDSSGLTLIPLNMAEPILIARGLDAEHGLGFSPHGAGRNFSRSAHMRRHAGRSEADILAAETAGIDARFFCGIPDLSELPSAYKDAASVRRQIDRYGLAEIVDTIEPVGSIMAGNWQRPFRREGAKRKLRERLKSGNAGRAR